MSLEIIEAIQVWKKERITCWYVVDKNPNCLPKKRQTKFITLQKQLWIFVDKKQTLFFLFGFYFFERIDMNFEKSIPFFRQTKETKRGTEKKK